MRRAITRVMVSVLGVVCVTVALVGLAQAIDPRQPSTPRFVVLPPDHVGQVWVLDTTTALRWQRTPGIPPAPWIPPDYTKTYTWNEATGNPEYTSDVCKVKLGDGARLPEVYELLSLVDYSVKGSSTPNIPVLPDGNPFENVQASDYWSATDFAANAPANPGPPPLPVVARAWRVGFRTGGSGQDNKIPENANDKNLVWCVRETRDAG